MSPTHSQEASPVTLSPCDAAFLAARLRRLFAHFNYTVPSFAGDDASLLRVAGSCIGAVLANLDADLTGGEEAYEDALLAYLESQKFHPRASHVAPDWRDGFNQALQTVINRIHDEQRLRADLTLARSIAGEDRDQLQHGMDERQEQR